MALATIEEIRDFKALHKDCEITRVRVEGDIEAGIWGFKCMEHDRHIVVKMPYPFCFGMLKCAGSGSCPRERACND